MNKLNYTDLTDKSVYYFQSGRFMTDYLALFHIEQSDEYFIEVYSENNADLFKVTREIYNSFNGGKNELQNEEQLINVLNENCIMSEETSNG